MNNEQRDEMLMEIHATTKVTAANFKNMNIRLGHVEKTVFGNGKPGIKEDIAILKRDYIVCPARKANSIENKRLRLSHVMIAIAIITLLVNTYMSIIS